MPAEALSMHPALPLALGVVGIAMTRGVLRDAVLLLAPSLALVAIVTLPAGAAVHVTLAGYAVAPVDVTPPRRLLAAIFVLVTLVGALFAMRQARRLELAAAYACAAAAVGAALAGDLITLFICVELMVIVSAFIVWAGTGAAATQAGLRYVLMQLFGAMLLKFGIEGVIHELGSSDIVPLALDQPWAWLVLAGLLVHAAAPPVSAWLPDAYAAASPTGSVFLSAYPTKVALLALLWLFAGETALIGFGLYMIGYAVVYGGAETDVRRLVCFVLIAQLGFAIAAIGVGTDLAQAGAVAHVVAHTLSIALLFMCVGALVQCGGVQDVRQLGGLWRFMPVTATCLVIGALSLSALPLTAAYAGQAAIAAAAGEAGAAALRWMLVAGSGGIALFATFKPIWFLFAPRDSVRRAADDIGTGPDDTPVRPLREPGNLRAALVLMAACVVLIGVVPGAVTPPQALPSATPFLLAALAAAVLLWAARPLLVRFRSIPVDTDWFWRRLLLGTGRRVIYALRRLRLAGNVAVRRASGRLSPAARLHGVSATVQVPRPRAARTAWPFGYLSAVGATTLWAATLLIVYVLFYYW